MDVYIFFDISSFMVYLQHTKKRVGLWINNSCKKFTFWVSDRDVNEKYTG